ncbi:hypothetical protein GCM10027074_74380 [Streptomyces deserti]
MAGVGNARVVPVQGRGRLEGLRLRRRAALTHGHRFHADRLHSPVHTPRIPASARYRPGVPLPAPRPKGMTRSVQGQHFGRAS